MFAIKSEKLILLFVVGLVVQVANAEDMDPATMAMIKTILKDPNMVKLFINQACKDPQAVVTLAKMAKGSGDGTTKPEDVKKYMKAIMEISTDPAVIKAVAQGTFGAAMDKVKDPMTAAKEAVGAVGVAGKMMGGLGR